MSDANRRIFPRAEGEYLAWFQVPGGSFEQCVALDIGLDGACLVLPGALPEGEEPFEVEFQLAPDWMVRAKATLLWQKAHSDLVLAGIRYRPVRSADRNLIGPWVHRQRKVQS
ncbi:MAG: PilZ domain-containing protein [Candidatus Eremiobacteraeota bacterium]|nr:PilZ domain-containing protein [Candidatus Eremiobacteraeota bacterium]MCW5868690.1 PilZ domain-containing protein [Candidatus Eremiobacteraeota bacterium]